MSGGPDTGVTTTRLQAIEVALEDVQAHELPATIVICRKRDMPSVACGTQGSDGHGCIYCYRHDVTPGDTAEEIEAKVRKYI